MQRLDIVHPGKGDLVVGPFAAHQDRDLVFAGALERPIIGRRHALDDFERIAAIDPIISIRDIPVSTCRPIVECARNGTHATPFLTTRPRLELVRSLRGESLTNSNITPDSSGQSPMEAGNG